MTWSDSYLSQSSPVEVTSVGGGLEMTHTLDPPDAPELYVRVVGTAP